ncbi:MAG: DNA mismatch repair protein MutS [Cryobacterium sp.]|nr:DNA mismatch repair protein MutS [Oligoflexia bacterium]
MTQASSATDVSLTPLMQQYWDLKSQAPDALLLFRMGDFYELFADDAVAAAKILEITLTSRDKGKENPMPMAGFPHHAVEPYIQKLLDHGKKVAIGEQTEDPSEAKKRGAKSIVRREIVRVFTPAVQFGAEGAETAYLATVITVGEKPFRYTLACLDPSTGETRLSLPLDERTLLEEAYTLPIRHFLRVGHRLPESVAASLIGRTGVLFEEVPDHRVGSDSAREIITAQFEVASLEPYLESGADLESSSRALALLLHYLRKSSAKETESASVKLSHVKLPTALHAARSMKLGPKTAIHLDLLPSNEQNAASSLFSRINHTKSSMGARQLKRWILEPLRTVNEIKNRQSGVAEFASDVRTNDHIQSALGQLYDLERILARVNTGLASPRDTHALGRSLSALSILGTHLGRFSSEIAVNLKTRIRACDEALRSLAEKILRTQREDAPFTSRDGGIFSKKTTPELDHLIDLTENGQRWLIDLEMKEREATGIGSLKVRYNRVFGYYIEITSTHLKSVPAHYQRKQTTAGGERFFTEELKKFEDEIVSAGDRQRAYEAELFRALLGEIQLHARAINEAAATLADLDATISLSRLAWESGWTFPVVDHSHDFEVEGGRHPLVDQGRGTFVPNDLRMHAARATTLLITGPNMGGKSTLLRQAALITILGQMGAPVPATSARWGVVSSIYTRIGAQDAIMRGQSTFMVEMTELAHILHYADARSLVVLDEIGRGTSTYDGISVAWSAIEWIVTKLGCRTLFATHYHELTRLPNFLPKIANSHMAVESSKSTLRFLYQLRDGPANESFGIQVAKLAGLPSTVVARAWKVLAELEHGFSDTAQPSLFDRKVEIPNDGTPLPNIADLDLGPTPTELTVLENLRRVDLNLLTPLQAMNWLAENQRTLAP